jgi:hypothetical protein
MESNQELFKQAILDAKAVRETSLAAARTTLAEHFEPLVKSMFQETVENIEEGEDETMDERKSMHQKDVDAEKAGKKVTKDIEWDNKHKNESADMEESSLDEILAELDALSEDDTMEEGDELEEAHVTTTAGYDEKAHTAKGDTNGSYSEKAKATHGNTNGSYSEKAKSSIHEAEEDDDTEEDDKDAEFDDKAEKAGKDVTKGIEGAHDDEESTDEQEVVDITVGELKDIIRDVFMTLQGGEEAALDADTDLAADLDMDTDAAGEEEISLEEILAELDREEEGKMEEAVGVPGAIQKDRVPGAIRASEDTVGEVKKELNEAVKTIKALKNELNEINLFNAKLMYVNKIFKAKNLNESQKTRVISAFDRATSVKEAENTFKTLSESISAAPKKSSLKESVGFASKAMGNAPARPIVEADAFVTRWQQLAGIK